MSSEQQGQVVEYKTFREFYPYYLKEHSNRTCRRLHVIGTSLGVLALLVILATQSWSYLWLPAVCGYGFAWVGHFFFEKNRPATFKYPLFSFRGDFHMCFAVWTGKMPF
jgi:hypothetical protein